MQSVKIIGICLISMICSFNILLAQEIEISFDEMWAIALERNLHIKNANLLIEKSVNMEKSAWDFGKLEFDYTRGQQNSYLIDNHGCESGWLEAVTLYPSLSYLQC